jgi:predicted ATP-binding protein involved in virulence
MVSTVRSIRAVGIHGRYDLELEFYPDVNILYGKNGAGKTTLLHILANILNADFERFAFLPFETIEVHLDDNQEIKLYEYTCGEENRIDVSLNKEEIASFSLSEIKQRLWHESSQTRRPILPTAYFPAFRAFIGAFGQEEEASLYRRRYVGEAKAASRPNSIDPTNFARRFFGDFVPCLSYPSLQEVSRRLSAEMQKALGERADVQEKSLKVINTYLNSVNRFLDDKQLILLSESPSALPTLLVKFHNTDLYSEMRVLSAGERQIVTLLYYVTHMSGQRVVLVDEPEISLRLDWQRWLVPEMVAQLRDVQIIMCTHSPMIGGAKYEDRLVKVENRLKSCRSANYL